MRFVMQFLLVSYFQLQEFDYTENELDFWNCKISFLISWVLVDNY